MVIRIGIDEIRIAGKKGELYVHQLADKNYMFSCEDVSYSMFDVAVMSGVTSQRIKGAIDAATQYRGLALKVIKQNKDIASTVLYGEDKISKDIRTILANRKVRG